MKRSAKEIVLWCAVCLLFPTHPTYGLKLHDGPAADEEEKKQETTAAGQACEGGTCAIEKFKELAQSSIEILQEEDKIDEEIKEGTTAIKANEEAVAESTKALQERRKEIEEQFQDALDGLPPGEAVPEGAMGQSPRGGGGAGSGAGGGGGGGGATKIPEFAKPADGRAFQMPTPPSDVDVPAIAGINQARSYDPQSFSPLNPKLATELMPPANTGGQTQKMRRGLDLSPMAMASGDGFKSLGSGSTPNSLGPQAGFADQGGAGGGGGGGGGAPGGGGGAPGGGATDGSSLNGVGADNYLPPDGPSGIRVWDLKMGAGGDGSSAGQAAAGGLGDTGNAAGAGRKSLAQNALRAGELRPSRPDPRAKGNPTVFAAFDQAFSQAIQSGDVSLVRSSSRPRSLASY